MGILHKYINKQQELVYLYKHNRNIYVLVYSFINK